MMGKTGRILLFATAMPAASAAGAVNKCTGADGRVTYQDGPCAGAGHKLDIDTAPARQPTSTPTADTTMGTAAKAKDWSALNRKLDLENRIPGARRGIDRKREACAKEQATLASRKQFANNNLAGATWEQSISTEMQSAAARCDTELRIMTDDLRRMEDELRSMQSGDYQY